MNRATIVATVVIVLLSILVSSGVSAQEGDAFEPNDDFASAAPLDPGTYTGLAITEGDIDWFAIELSTDHTLSASIAFSHEEGDLELLLAGPDRTLLEASTSVSDNEALSHVANETGTYYIGVYGFDGATGPYDLTIQIEGEG